jgi:hypothetical protein
MTRMMSLIQPPPLPSLALPPLRSSLPSAPPLPSRLPAVSGMFLDEPNIDNVSVYPSGIQWIATAANVTASTTNADCIAA